jgi:hypothetical protein
MKVPRLPSALILSLLSLLALPRAALADDQALRQCRALGEAQARLACYDRIPLGAPAAIAAAPAAAPAPVVAPAPAVAAERNFGMEAEKRKEAEPSSIESTIVGDFDGWAPGAQIRLANGQVWRVVDGSNAVLSPMKNPKVRIARNMIGTLFMEIEGTNNSPKVRRVR